MLQYCGCADGRAPTFRMYFNFIVVLEQYTIAIHPSLAPFCTCCMWRLYHLPLQENRGIIVTRIDGKIYDGVFSSKGEEWKKRRRVLTPAFSANKMKMVSLRWLTYQNIELVNSALLRYNNLPMCVCVCVRVCVCVCHTSKFHPCQLWQVWSHSLCFLCVCA